MLVWLDQRTPSSFSGSRWRINAGFMRWSRTPQSTIMMPSTARAGRRGVGSRRPSAADVIRWQVGASAPAPPGSCATAASGSTDIEGHGDLADPVDLERGHQGARRHPAAGGVRLADADIPVRPALEWCPSARRRSTTIDPSDWTTAAIAARSPCPKPRCCRTSSTPTRHCAASSCRKVPFVSSLRGGSPPAPLAGGDLGDEVLPAGQGDCKGAFGQRHVRRSWQEVWPVWSRPQR